MGSEMCIRDRSEAIARNLREMCLMPVPIIATVIGEGGSGGALAIGVADKVNMLQYSIYSVISPEGCASILWKSAEHAEIAADTLSITSDRLKQLELVDNIVSEPPGGAHRDMEAIAASLRSTLIQQLSELDTLPAQDLLDKRYERLSNLGRFETGVQ